MTDDFGPSQMCYGMSVGIAMEFETLEDVSLTGAILKEALTHASFTHLYISNGYRDH